MFCPTCGQANEQGATQCTRCGGNIFLAPPQPPPIPQRPVQVFVQPPPAAPRSSMPVIAIVAIIAAVVGLVFLAIVAVLAAIAVPNFLEAQTRAKVIRVKADMRTYATALESYYIDQKAYPPSRATTQGNVNSGLAAQDPSLNGQTTFSSHVLTSPVAYLSALPSDPFARAKGATFSYYSTHSADGRNDGWILWSPGPDGQYDLTGDKIAQIGGLPFDQSTGWPALLISNTFDPTNGTVSRGDIWRVKQ